MDTLEKLRMKMKEKKAGGMSDMERKSKINAVKELREVTRDAMRGRLGGLKKVSVSSDSPEGLKAGLEKANEMISKHPGEDSPMGADGSPEAEAQSEYEKDHLATEGDPEESSEEESPADQKSEDDELAALKAEVEKLKEELAKAKGEKEEA